MGEFMDWLKDFSKSLFGVVVFFLAIAIFGLIIFRVTFVRFVDNYEIGYTYNTWTGNVKHLDRTGYILRTPFIERVHTIDGRPMQVCISSINRVLNCKLVQFNPKGLEMFVSWHGRDDYHNDFFSTVNRTPSVFNQILMAYAYEGSGKEYPFLTIIRELKPSEIGATSR